MDESSGINSGDSDGGDNGPIYSYDVLMRRYSMSGFLKCRVTVAGILTLLFIRAGR